MVTSDSPRAHAFLAGVGPRRTAEVLAELELRATVVIPELRGLAHRLREAGLDHEADLLEHHCHALAEPFSELEEHTDPRGLQGDLGDDDEALRRWRGK